MSHSGQELFNRRQCRHEFSSPLPEVTRRKALLEGRVRATYNIGPRIFVWEHFACFGRRNLKIWYYSDSLDFLCPWKLDVMANSMRRLRWGFPRIDPALWRREDLC